MRNESLYTQKPAKGSYYPPYFRSAKQKPRQRTFAWMDVDLRHNKVTITDEHGEQFRYTRGEYTAVRDAAIERGWTLFARLRAGAGRYPWLIQSLSDESATLLASGRCLERGKFISGIEWRRGRHRAKVIDPDSWGYGELVYEYHASVGEFLQAVRRTCNRVGCGDYDTPSALGTAALQKAWQEAHLGRLWILPKELRDWFHSNPSHPRIWDRDTDCFYSGLIEFDLRAAYGTTLAGKLALGHPCYVSQAEATPDVVRGTALCADGQAQTGSTPEQESTGIAYGLWRCEVCEPILRGPVRWLWSGPEPSFDIDPGVYAVPLFTEQARALASCGAVVTWTRGYYWPETGTPFAGYVKEQQGHRKQADSENDPLSAQMHKRVVNATVGRFNCYQSSTVVPYDRCVEGDAVFSLSTGDTYQGAEDATLAAIHTTSTPTCVPEHWYAYIVSQVGLRIWEAERAAAARGCTVVSANIDSYRIVQPTLAGITEQADVGWKTILIKDATIRASRSIDGWMSSDHGCTWIRLVRQPGVRRA